MHGGASAIEDEVSKSTNRKGSPADSRSSARSSAVAAPAASSMRAAQALETRRGCLVFG